MGEYAITFLAGICISMIVSSFGLGGGILWLPFFMLYLHLSPENAVITSLMIQLAGLGSGGIAYIREGAVDYRLAGFILALGIPGIFAGVMLSHAFDPAVIRLVLGVLMMITAFLFVSAYQGYPEKGVSRLRLKKLIPYSGIPIMVSVGNGMLSTGLGEWMIPVLQGKLGLDIRNAIATCLFVMFLFCLVSGAMHLAVGGRPHWMLLSAAIPGVVIGGQAGPALTRYISQVLLKEMFIFLLTLIGIHLIYNSF